MNIIISMAIKKSLPISFQRDMTVNTMKTIENDKSPINPMWCTIPCEKEKICDVLNKGFLKSIRNGINQNEERLVPYISGDIGIFLYLRSIHESNTIIFKIAVS